MMKPLIQVIRELEGKGFREVFRAERDGLRATSSGQLHPLSEAEVHQRVRVENESDPDCQILVFALRMKDDGVRGTYTVAHGPAMDPVDADTVTEL